jgi:hypothetical protein
MRDVHLAHGGMTARLDQVAPEVDPTAKKGRAGKRDRDAGDPEDDLDVPEFVPPS